MAIIMRHGKRHSRYPRTDNGCGHSWDCCGCPILYGQIGAEDCYAVVTFEEGPVQLCVPGLGEAFRYALNGGGAIFDGHGRQVYPIPALRYRVSVGEHTFTVPPAEAWDYAELCAGRQAIIATPVEQGRHRPNLP